MQLQTHSSPTKLTLSINPDVITQAKQYAKKHNNSLSSLVERYFRQLVVAEVEEDAPVSRLVQELTGIIKVKEPVDDKKELVDYLMEKYK